MEVVYVDSMREIAFQQVSQVMRTLPLMFSPRDTVSRFIINLHRLGSCEALVVFRKRIGIVTALDVLDAMHPERTLLGNVARRATSISRKATVLEAAGLMISNRLRMLPVTEGRGIIGTISCNDILNTMIEFSAFGDVACKDVMRLSALSVEAHEKISTARSIMCRHDVDCLPVVDEKGRVEGVITARDIVLAFVQPTSGVTRGEIVGESTRIWNIPIRELMDTSPLTAKEDSSLADVAEAFGRAGKETCIIERRSRLGVITPMEIISLLPEFRAKRVIHVRILGLPVRGDFLSIGTIQGKIDRVLTIGLVFRKNIKEVVIDVKPKKQSGERTFYQIIARVYSSSRPLVVTAHGWYLAEAFDRLRDKLDRVLRKSKRRRPRVRGVYAS